MPRPLAGQRCGAHYERQEGISLLAAAGGQLAWDRPGASDFSWSESRQGGAPLKLSRLYTSYSTFQRAPHAQHQPLQSALAYQTKRTVAKKPPVREPSSTAHLHHL